MDIFEKRVIQFTLALIALMIFAVLQSKRISASSIPGCIPYDESYLESRVEQLDELTYQVFVNASMWNFDPEEVRLPVGASVDFYLTSTDVVHGFNIAPKNINLMAVPGVINKTTITFDEPGVYDVVCHEYCGSGHHFMRGEIIVNYPTK